MRPVNIGERVTTKSFSGATELHWSVAKHEVWTPAKAGAAAYSWFDVDLDMVRAPNRPPGSRAIAGLYYWDRTGNYHWFESQAEKDMLMWLDFGGDVRDVRSQPFTVVFSATETPLGWHTPDFMLLHVNGEISVVDVRPVDLTDEKAEKTFIATRTVLDRVGLAYQVLDAGQDRRTANLKWIKCSRHARFRPPADVEEILLQHARNGMTRQALAMAVAPHPPTCGNAWIDNLVWRRLLTFDMDLRYSVKTVLTTAKEGFE